LPQDISTTDRFSLEGYEALRGGAGLVDRSTRGRLRLTGQDRRDYLQGLLTNDIAALTPGSGCYACLLTAQGRMISDMFVVETGDAVLLDLEPELTLKVFTHLEQFVFTEDVQVIDETESLAQLGVFGPRAGDVLSTVFGHDTAVAADAVTLDALPVLGNRSLRWKDHSVVVMRRDDVGVPGFDVLIARGIADELSAAIRDAGAVVVDADTVEVGRVESGRPVFHKDMTEETIPLEAGIEDRALSLTKGCYVGQEIIIRVLHRGGGRVAKRLVGLTFDPDAVVPRPGSTVRSEESRDIGRVTSAVWSPRLQRPIALGYVHRDFVDSGTRVIVAAAGGVELAAVVTYVPFVQSSQR
jgi:tRNA-modifying protein YgfZ